MIRWCIEMEIKIKDEKFYILEAGDEKCIYDTESNAIESLKMLITSNKNLNPENVKILEVNTKKEQWEIKGVPWSNIAIRLIRGE